LGFLIGFMPNTLVANEGATAAFGAGGRGAGEVLGFRMTGGFGFSRMTDLGLGSPFGFC